MQHLQRAGVPSQVNTGKGTRASYGWRQMVELTVALDFIDLGLRPEVVTATIRANTEKLLGSLNRILSNLGSEKACSKAIVKGRCPYKCTEVVVTAAGLLTMSQGESGNDSYLLTISASDFKAHVDQDPGVHPIEAQFDFGSRMMSIAQLIGREAFPGPLETASDLWAWSNDWAHKELEP
ncbi:hypothetical protein ACX40Y_09545 [Sphingomonas sp. RS6]